MTNPWDRAGLERYVEEEERPWYMRTEAERLFWEERGRSWFRRLLSAVLRWLRR